MKSRILLGLIVPVLFSGCAAWNSIARKINVNEGAGQLIDAKQRAIIVVQKQGENPNDANRTIVCAEPSPDALSAYAMQLALEGKIPTGEGLKLAGGSQEGAAYIGLRTQSIQLLRDAMYRNCEAYANGAIDEAEYAIAARRHQRNMVALLAIEQLTGAIRVPPITITSESVAEVAKTISQMQAEADALDKEISKLAQDINDINTTGKSEQEVKVLNEKISKLENQKSSREQTKKALEEGITNARGIIATGATSVTVHGDVVISRNAQQIENVSDAVVKIFKDINNADDFAQMCLSYLMKDRNTSICGENKNTMNCICLDHLKQLTEAKKTNIKFFESLNTIIQDLNDSEKAKIASQVFSQYLESDGTASAAAKNLSISPNFGSSLNSTKVQK